MVSHLCRHITAAKRKRPRRAGLIKLRSITLYAPLEVCMRHYTWCKSLTGLTQGPMPLFWDVSKTV
jgi:hypothetical protein